ncbi:hypothetical protein FRB90_009914 [Tulasnella sp. 427]|nr:hypothetical protein FRB90_009914 [Tulasnella sp. 427]
MPVDDFISTLNSEPKEGAMVPPPKKTKQEGASKEPEETNPEKAGDEAALSPDFNSLARGGNDFTAVGSSFFPTQARVTIHDVIARKKIKANGSEKFKSDEEDGKGSVKDVSFDLGDEGDDENEDDELDPDEQEDDGEPGDEGDEDDQRLSSDESEEEIAEDLAKKAAFFCTLPGGRRRLKLQIRLHHLLQRQRLPAFTPYNPSDELHLPDADPTRSDPIALQGLVVWVLL